MIAVSDMGWGPWWDADARIRETELERQLRVAQHDLPAPRVQIVAERDADRDGWDARRDGPGTVDVESPLAWSQMADELLVSDLYDLSQDEGSVVGIGRIRSRYGIGAGRAGRLQAAVRQVWDGEGDPS